METVSPQEALQMVNAGLAYGIDVREIDEWNAGHFELFTLSPLSEFEEAVLPTDKPIIFICRSGNRSGQVTMQLETYGLDVANMSGGMLSWHEAGLPMSGDNDSPYVA